MILKERKTPYDLKYVRSWRMASVPQGQPDLFPETVSSTRPDSAFNSKRAKLSLVQFGSCFFRQMIENLTPSNIGPEEQSDHWVRTILQNEIFPDLQLQQGQPQQLATLDLSFYPDERGQYNFNTEDLQEDGTLQNPKENWGGIMRRIETNDF